MNQPRFHHDRHLVDNGFGWRLAITRHRDREKPIGRPLLIVPGYGMNSFIFGFHPKGPSLVETLVARGLEVWTADLRGQGRSIRARDARTPTGKRGDGRNYGMAELAIDDVGAAVAHVLAHTATGEAKVDLLGASLGAALSFAHVACVRGAPVHAMISMAGLVTWIDAHPAVRIAFSSPRLAGMMRLRHTRSIARLVLPIVSKVAPSLLSVYVNSRSTDLSQATRMVQTVEDPHPVINREIAEWILRRDLVIRGVNVSSALPELRHPFFCIVANDDGIVLPATARHMYDAIGSENKHLLLVGEPGMPIAHADLFLCTGAQERVFAPIADFLLSV